MYLECFFPYSITTRPPLKLMCHACFLLRNLSFSIQLSILTPVAEHLELLIISMLLFIWPLKTVSIQLKSSIEPFPRPPFELHLPIPFLVDRMLCTGRKWRFSLLSFHFIMPRKLVPKVTRLNITTQQSRNPHEAVTYQVVVVTTPRNGNVPFSKGRFAHR